MPRLDPWAWSIWVAVMAAQIALLAIMVNGRLWRRWPSIFALLLLRNLVSIFLLTSVLSIPQPLEAAVYFYVYWAAEGLSCAVRVWIVVDLASASCVASPRILPLVRRIVPAIAFLFLGISFLIAANSPIRYSWVLIQTTIGFSRAISLTWLATFVVMAYTCEFFGLKWGASDRILAIGFSIQAVSATIVSWLIGISTSMTTVWSDTQDFLYLASLVIWATAIIWNRDSAERAMSLSDLRSISEAYFSLGRKLRGR